MSAGAGGRRAPTDAATVGTRSHCSLPKGVVGGLAPVGVLRPPCVYQPHPVIDQAQFLCSNPPAGGVRIPTCRCLYVCHGHGTVEVPTDNEAGPHTPCIKRCCVPRVKKVRPLFVCLLYTRCAIPYWHRPRSHREDNYLLMYTTNNCLASTRLEGRNHRKFPSNSPHRS